MVGTFCKARVLGGTLGFSAENEHEFTAQFSSFGFVGDSSSPPATECRLGSLGGSFGAGLELCLIPFRGFGGNGGGVWSSSLTSTCCDDG
mmetsp:Transcript_44225/g.70690  ORF Transcript_44225/g.70690 Transcript_44225/m.70690 type:complete len:90 (-) Transcript_44225:4427-4696(-)